MMVHKIIKFTKLSSEEKKLFLEAYITLGIMRASILTISFKHLTRSLDHRKDRQEPIQIKEDEMQKAINVGKAIIKASNHTPWESTCLVQSLSVQKMLQKRDIPGVFYLGAAKDEESKEKMKAHSWSQCGEKIITGGEGHESFTVLSVFGWGRE